MARHLSVNTLIGTRSREARKIAQSDSHNGLKAMTRLRAR